MRSIVISVCVCLFCVSVCLSACTSQKLQSKFHEIFCTYYPGRVSVLLWRQWDMLFPVLWVTSLFRIMEGIGPNQRRRVYSSSSSCGGTSQTSDNVFWSRSPGGSTVGEVCRLRLHIVLYCTAVYIKKTEFRKFIIAVPVTCNSVITIRPVNK